MKLGLSSIAGGLALFVWAFVVHGVVGWYDPAFHRFADERAISEALEQNALQRGVYYVPYDTESDAGDTIEALVNVLPRAAKRSMPLQLGVGLAIHVLSVWLVILLIAPHLLAGYWSVVARFALAGLTISFVTQAYYWNWFGFPSVYFALSVGDALGGWTTAGLAVAWIYRSRNAAARS